MSLTWSTNSATRQYRAALGVQEVANRTRDATPASLWTVMSLGALVTGHTIVGLVPVRAIETPVTLETKKEKYILIIHVQ